MLFTWGMMPVWPVVTREGPLSRLKLEGCTAVIAVSAVQEYLQPLRYGDTLTLTTQISAIGEEKTIPPAMGHFVSTKTIFRNQHGQVVGTHTFTLFMYRPGAREGDA
jgi:acyl-CoA thioesterase FadM